MRHLFIAAAAVAIVAGGGLAAVAQSQAGFGAAAVDTARQKAADKEPGTWMSAGRTYDEQRYSPLTQINAGNVSQLGLAWYGDIDTERGQEATSIVVDGVLYVTSAWSMVKAYNARTGEKIWEYDPKIDRNVAQISCCDVVNRGVTAWKGRIYLGALDGRLIALDSKTGAKVWEVQTTDLSRPYTITAQPRIVNDKVIIGNGGAEYYTRGYVTAYDAATGKQIWRFYTVPGDPSKPFEQPELKKAAETWKGQWWDIGGGGTVWDGIAYDTESRLLYLGVGNGDPWNASIRSPGGGDNLFLTSIVAVNVDTGKYVWHYQQTNGETWDHTATQPMIVATIPVNGKKRRVVMQAPKNGFFYVLDAKTGKLLSAEKFAPVNWATHIDMKTGRPVENPETRFDRTRKPAIVSPGPLGAHNWHPMSYSPRTGLVYIPVTENNAGYDNPAKPFVLVQRQYNTGVNAAGAASLYNLPGAPPRGNVKSYLQAYNPSTQKEVWRVPNEVFGASGVMATASDLVFSGNHAGDFSAYDAKTGSKLWSVKTQARIVAAPMTYTIDGEQYVAVLVGARGLPGSQVRTSKVSANNSRLLVYKLGGKAVLPAAAYTAGAVSTTSRTLNPPLLTGNNEQVIDGEGLYARLCAGCHGANTVADKTAPDLRYTTLLHSLPEWQKVVMDGTRLSNGMPGFKSTISAADSETIWHYVISQANKDKAKEAAAAR